MRAHCSDCKTLGKGHFVDLCLRAVDAIQNLVGLLKRPHEQERAGASDEGVHGPPNAVFGRQEILAKLLGGSSQDLAPERDELTKGQRQCIVAGFGLDAHGGVGGEEGSGAVGGAGART